MNLNLRSVARRIRDGSVDTLRAVDDVLEPRLQPRRNRRIVFDGASPFEFAMFRPVWERLREDSRLEVWFTASRLEGSPAALYHDLGVPPERVLSRLRARLGKFDVHVSAQYFTVPLIRSAWKVHIFHGVGGKAWNISEKARQYDRVFVISEYDRERFVRAGIFPEGSSVLDVVGMPKTDCLVDGTLQRGACLEDLELPTERPSVLYAPTWQTTSSLYRFGRELIAQLADGPWSLLVKLHDNCFRPDLDGGVNWERELDPFRNRPNVRILRQADISPVLAASDLMISDLSSAALEFCLLDRPVVVADAPELFQKYHLDEVSHWQQRLGPLLTRADDAPRMVRHALEHPDAYGPIRRRVASTVFHDPGNATNHAVRSLYRLLDRRAADSSP